MRQQNGRLIAVVAAVAVAAIAIGGAVASRQGPQTANATTQAAPLGIVASQPTTPSTPLTPTPAATPSITPVVKPTQKPVVTPQKTLVMATGPVRSAVDLSTLAPGRAPQIPYLSGRTVRGGAGRDVKIPGTDVISRVGRLNGSVLAIVLNNATSTLLAIDQFSGKVYRRTPGILNLVTADDGQAAAYSGDRFSTTGAKLPGSVLYAEGNSVSKLELPDVDDVRPIGEADGTVYFRGAPLGKPIVWSLYAWNPGASRATPVKTVPFPTVVSSDGTTAGSLSNVSDYVSCTNLLSVASGRRLWRSCDYQVTGLTPDGSTALGGPYFREGTGNVVVAAMDAKTGAVLHEWSGPFLDPVAEDDQHVLLQTMRGDDTPNAILRCTTTTGACELATPLAKGILRLGS